MTKDTGGQAVPKYSWDCESHDELWLELKKKENEADNDSRKE